MLVAAAVSNGREAYSKSLEVLPDIVLLDMDIPELSGIQTAKLIKKAHKEIKVVFYSSLSDGKTIIEALKSGAEGYILKDTFGEELVSLLRNVDKGTCVLSSNARRTLAEELIKYDDGSPPLHLNIPSEGDMRILLHICDGKTDKEIAEDLKLKVADVTARVESVMKNAGVKSRGQFVAWALKNKII
jgi:DNA-binding NarL/FixJ family response regulator